MMLCQIVVGVISYTLPNNSQSYDSCSLPVVGMWERNCWRWRYGAAPIGDGQRERQTVTIQKRVCVGRHCWVLHFSLSVRCCQENVSGSIVDCRSCVSELLYYLCQLYMGFNMISGIIF